MSMFYNIKDMSTSGLKAMQRAIHDRLVEEDNQPNSMEKIYGVREHHDWKAQADEIEAELDCRSVTYTKVPW